MSTETNDDERKIPGRVNPLSFSDATAAVPDAAAAIRDSHWDISSKNVYIDVNHILKYLQLHT